MRKLKILAALFAILSVPSLSHGTDIPINPTGTTFLLQPTLAWGQAGAQGFNNNYFFVPIVANENVCVYVFNNNPTNAHTFSGVIKVNGNPNNTTPSDATWQGLGTVTSTVSASPSAPAIFGNLVSGTALVSINFSGSTTQAGSPDTATIVIIQSSGPCLSNNPIPSTQIGTQLSNSENTSAVNTLLTVTFPNVTNTRSVVYSVSGRCSAGTAQLTISIGGTQVWSTGATEVTTTTFRYQWNPGLTGSQGASVSISITACGVGNTGTLDIQASTVFQQ
jgi:hypothetical protein